MFKRLGAILISFSILLGLNSTIFVYAEDDNADVKAVETKAEVAEQTENTTVPEKKESDETYKQYINFFSSLGISFADTGAQTKITRTDFAKWLYAFIGEDVNLSELRAKQAFEDVQKSNKDAGYIVYAYEKGLMKAKDGNKFCPEDIVTVEEASYSAIKLLGYHLYFQISEDSPLNAYQSVAISEGILDTIDKTAYSDGMDTQACAILFYNIANTSVAENKFVGTKIRVELDKLYMTKYFDVEYMTGVMYSDGVTSISENVSECFVTVGNITFDDCENVNTQGFIGKRVTAYYKVVSDEKVLIQLVVNKKNEMLTLYPTQIIDYDSFVYYYETENGNEKKIVVPKSISIIYNGSVVDASTVSQVDYEPENGYIELIDNDRDGNYDVLIIYDYEYYLVEEHNLLLEKINSKLTNDVISYNDSKYQSVKWYDALGNAILIENVTEGMTIAVLENLNKDRMTIYAYTKSVSGDIDSINKSSTDGYIGISGKRYEIPSTKAGKLALANLGQSAVLYLDMNGMVYDFKISGDNSFAVGYLIKAYYDEEVEAMFMKYYDSVETKVVTREINEKVNIDGTVYRSIIAYEDLFIDTATKATKYQVLRIKCNSDGKINRIDLANNTTNALADADGDLQAYYITPVKNQTTGEKSGIYVVDNGFALLHSGSYKPVGLARNDMPVMYVPENRKDETSYQMKTYSQFQEENIIDFYKIMDEGLYPDIAVCYGGNGVPEEGGTSGVNHIENLTKDMPVSAVIDVNEILNANDEVVTELTLMTEGKREVLEVYDNILATQTVPVKPGEIIRYCVNGSGKIWGIERALKAEDIMKNTGVLAPDTVNHLLPEYRLTVFSAYYRNGDALILTLQEPETLNMSTLTLPDDGQIYNVSSFTNVYYYDKKLKDFILADESYIKDYVKYGNKRSRIAIRTKNGGFVDMYIYDSDALN